MREQSQIPHWTMALTASTLARRIATEGTAALVFGGSAIALLSNGKFLVTSGGLPSGALTRYNSNGSLDTTFGTSGQEAALAAPGIAVQSNGRIVTAGSIVTQTSLTSNSSSFGLIHSV